jgi:hypothetical protein
MDIGTKTQSKLLTLSERNQRSLTDSSIIEVKYCLESFIINQAGSDKKGVMRNGSSVPILKALIQSFTLQIIQWIVSIEQAVGNRIGE